MKLDVKICERSGEVVISLSTSSKKRKAICLGVLERDQSGEPTRLILDRKVLSETEALRLENSRWHASGSYTTELNRITH